MTGRQQTYSSSNSSVVFNFVDIRWTEHWCCSLFIFCFAKQFLWIIFENKNSHSKEFVWWLIISNYRYCTKTFFKETVCEFPKLESGSCHSFTVQNKHWFTQYRFVSLGILPIVLALVTIRATAWSLSEPNRVPEVVEIFSFRRRKQELEGWCCSENFPVDFTYNSRDPFVVSLMAT